MTPTILLSLLIIAAPAKAESSEVPTGSATADEGKQEPTSVVDAGVERYPVHIVIDTHELLVDQVAEIVAQTDDAFSRDIVALFVNDVDIRRRSGPDAVELKISLKWVDFKQSIYGATVTAARPDGTTRTHAFEMMGEYYDVIERIEADAPKYLAWFERGEDSGTKPPHVEPPEHPPGGNPNPKPPFKHTLRWVGVGVGAAGLAAGVAGAVLFSQTEDDLVFEAMRAVSSPFANTATCCHPCSWALVVPRSSREWCSSSSTRSEPKNIADQGQCSPLHSPATTLASR